MRHTYCSRALNCKKVMPSGLAYSGPDTVREFMWQEDPVGIAKFISECADKVYALAAGPSHDG